MDYTKLSKVADSFSHSTSIQDAKSSKNASKVSPKEVREKIVSDIQSRLDKGQCIAMTDFNHPSDKDVLCSDKNLVRASRYFIEHFCKDPNIKDVHDLDKVVHFDLMAPYIKIHLSKRGKSLAYSSVGGSSVEDLQPGIVWLCKDFAEQINRGLYDLDDVALISSADVKFF